VRENHNPWRITSVRDDIRLHEVNFLDREALMCLVGEIKPEWIFHLAVHGAYSWQTELHKMVETNIVSTINLVEACLKTGFEALINTGSSSEYGFKDYAPAENDYPEPNSHYAATKLSATFFCRYIARARGVRLHTLRLYSVYGPYEEPKRLMPTLITQGLKGRLPKLVNPDVAHDYVYVDDVCDAYILAATSPNQEPGAIYNVGTAVQTPLREVITIAQKVLNIKAEPVWGSMPNRQWDTHRWVADNRKIKEMLGWRTKYTFEQGFQMMADWFRDNPIKGK